MEQVRALKNVFLLGAGGGRGGVLIDLNTLNACKQVLALVFILMLLNVFSKNTQHVYIPTYMCSIFSVHVVQTYVLQE